jgi:hypothetical protein
MDGDGGDSHGESVNIAARIMAPASETALQTVGKSHV